MREIKFRGIDDDTGEFVYGWYTKMSEGVRRFDAIISEIEGVFTRFYIHSNKTIGQYTGLKDKNGVEIYEGDIVSFKSRTDRSKGVIFYDYHNTRFGILMTGKYAPEFGDNTRPLGSGWYGTEVIGNVHEEQK